MKSLNRKYAKDVKEIVETSGFESYTSIAKTLSTKFGYYVDDTAIRSVMQAMHAEGVLEYTPRKQGRPAKTKVLLTMTTQQMCEKYGVSRITPKVSLQIEADGWKKSKLETFPFSTSYMKMV